MTVLDLDSTAVDAAASGAVAATSRRAPERRAASPLVFPVLGGVWTLGEAGLRCAFPRHTVEVRAPFDLIEQVRGLCNGQRRWAVAERLLAERWGASTAATFLRDLVHCGALIEAGSQLAAFAQVGWAPQPYRAPLTAAADLWAHRTALDRRLVRTSARTRHAPTDTALSSLLARRGSAATFGEPDLPWQSIVNVLWALYGVVGPSEKGGLRRTVPSGGGLYAIDWYLALLVDAKPQRAGLYRVRYHACGQERGDVSLHRCRGEASTAWRTLITPAVLSHAQAVIYPVVNLPAVEAKYGNRALTLAMLEAGHAMQNAALAATLEGAASIARGDTIETEVLDLLRLRQGAYPLPALVIGRKPNAGQLKAAQKANEHVPLRSVPNSSRGLRMPTHHCVAGPLELGKTLDFQVWSSGRSPDPQLAAVKAEAEGWERIGWATPRIAQVARMRDVAHAVDPRLLVSYAAEQHARPTFPFSKWSDRRSYPWTAGVDVSSGHPAALMAQCVYALSSLQSHHARQPFTNASTSGVAAWPDAQGAVGRAVAELIERDAFARAWLLQCSPSRLPIARLPNALRARLLHLEKAGYRISAHLLPSKYLPVVCVFAQCAAKTLTSVTTAAGFSVEEALAGALSEAEGRIQGYHREAAPPDIDIAAVVRETDHATFYRTAAGYRAADVLASSARVAGVDECKAIDRAARGGFAHLLSRVHSDGRSIYAVDLTPPGASLKQGRVALHVWRAFVPGLLPLWFGLATEPLGLIESGVVDLGIAQSRQQMLLRTARSVHPCT